ncbi:MAG TPA: hypothetical protein VHA77_05275 [Xanthobacteraceae bacterium]|nr:hypothetical protein [Xanthobacteraceae bacterium]
MSTLTRPEVTAVLGPVDDIVAAEIIATGATPAELAEARAWITADEAMVNAGRKLPSGRVGKVIEILERIESEPITGSPLGDAGSTLE